MLIYIVLTKILKMLLRTFNILDTQQAFDEVWHHRLLYKLKRNVPDQLYVILRSYISNRYFQVKIENILSHYHPIQSGVPQ